MCAMKPEVDWRTAAEHLLRPPGGGIPAVSAGKGAALSLQRELYGVSSEEQVRLEWERSWDDLSRSRVILLGVPLDTGAGIRRGAAYGPRAVRRELLRMPRFRELLQKKLLVDLGDIYVNPHLLHDEMLNSSQIRSSQEMMYPDAPPALRSQLPVSALSQLGFFLQLLFQSYPKSRLFVIGGDHSAAWPVTEILSRRFPKTLGIVQPDAHTDLLPSRLGVKYCFGTWSFHANELLGGAGKLVQLGIRQSSRDRSHWEGATGVRQFWAEEILRRPASEIIQELVDHLQSRGVRQIYFSNDIDGTDEAYAAATGTPASGGLTPDFILQTIQALGANFEIVGADIMEVAPDLGSSDQSKKTCELAARYALACLELQSW